MHEKRLSSIKCKNIPWSISHELLTSKNYNHINTRIPNEYIQFLIIYLFLLKIRKDMQSKVIQKK
jgi:hypothetical protein